MSFSFTAAFNLIFLNIISNILRLFTENFKLNVSENSQVIIMVLVVISVFTHTQITRFM